MMSILKSKACGDELNQNRDCLLLVTVCDMI